LIDLDSDVGSASSFSSDELSNESLNNEEDYLDKKLIFKLIDETIDQMNSRDMSAPVQNL